MSHIYSRSLFHIRQPEILQLTAPTGLPNNVTPNRGAPNPSQCRDARRDAVWPTAAKASPKQANQKHELEFDRDRYLPSDLLAEESWRRSRNLIIATRHHAMAWEQCSPRSCLTEIISKKWNIARRCGRSFVAAATDIDVIGTPLRAHEDLHRANPSRVTSAE
jgi:hypothetical protein